MSRIVTKPFRVFENPFTIILSLLESLKPTVTGLACDPSSVMVCFYHLRENICLARSNTLPSLPDIITCLDACTPCYWLYPVVHDSFREQLNSQKSCRKATSKHTCRMSSPGPKFYDRSNQFCIGISSKSSQQCYETLSTGMPFFSRVFNFHISCVQPPHV